MNKYPHILVGSTSLYYFSTFPEGKLVNNHTQKVMERAKILSVFELKQRK